ncbi:MAG: hypothetical protein ABJO09_12145 [Hyphomicrobiales bacterium]
MSGNGPNATERQKGAFGLLLRRLSAGAGLSSSQNSKRDQIYKLAANNQFEQAFQINHRLLQEVSHSEPGSAPNSENTDGLFKRIFGRKTVYEPNIPAPEQSTEQQLATLALDRAVLLGMNGQPGEADDLLDKLMDARGDDPGQRLAEDIFEVALGLSDLSGSISRRRDVLRARMSFFFDMALEHGDDEKLHTALQASETLQADILGEDDLEHSPDTTRLKADMMRRFGEAHERTGLLKSAAGLLSKAATHLRKNGQMKDSYDLTLESLEADIALASLMADTSELHVLSNRLRDIVDLPDTMITTQSRGQARYILGTCLAQQSEIDGKIVTLRKAFGYFESAAKHFADLGMEAKELQSLRDLALAKLSAAELLALDNTADTDLILAQRYNAEAMQLQQQLSARLS